MMCSPCGEQARGTHEGPTAGRRLTMRGRVVWGRLRPIATGLNVPEAAMRQRFCRIDAPDAACRRDGGRSAVDNPAGKFLCLQL